MIAEKNRRIHNYTILSLLEVWGENSLHQNRIPSQSTKMNFRENSHFDGNTSTRASFSEKLLELEESEPVLIQVALGSFTQRLDGMKKQKLSSCLLLCLKARA